jgi:hypothetical protein
VVDPDADEAPPPVVDPEVECEPEPAGMFGHGRVVSEVGVLAVPSEPVVPAEPVVPVETVGAVLREDTAGEVDVLVAALATAAPPSTMPAANPVTARTLRTRICIKCYLLSVVDLSATPFLGP